MTVGGGFSDLSWAAAAPVPTAARPTTAAAKCQLMDVCVVRYVSHGQRFELPCVRAAYEAYCETRRDSVGSAHTNSRSPSVAHLPTNLVIGSNVFTNAHKREVARRTALLEVFGTVELDAIAPMVLAHGKRVETERERREQREVVRRHQSAVMKLVTTLLVNPFTGVETDPHDVQAAMSQLVHENADPMKLVADNVIAAAAVSGRLVELVWLHAFHVSSAVARMSRCIDAVLPARRIVVRYVASTWFYGGCGTPGGEAVERREGGSSAHRCRDTLDDAWSCFLLDFDGAVVCRQRLEEAAGDDVADGVMVTLALLVHSSLMVSATRFGSTQDEPAEDTTAGPGATLLPCSLAGPRWVQLLRQSVLLGESAVPAQEAAYFNQTDLSPSMMFSVGSYTVAGQRSLKGSKNMPARDMEIRSAAPAERRRAGGDSDDDGVNHKGSRGRRGGTRKEAEDASGHHRKTHKQLQELCKQYGLSTGGKKQDLIERVTMHEQVQA